MYVCMYGWMDGWVIEWMHARMYVCVTPHVVFIHRHTSNEDERGHHQAGGTPVQEETGSEIRGLDSAH